MIDGAAGSVKVGFADGSAYTFASLQVGLPYPMKVRRVWATGTTATNIVVFY
jgi:hypothetical protein